MVVNKRAQQARDRSRSRSRGRKSTPIKSARRMPVSESVVRLHRLIDWLTDVDWSRIYLLNSK